jgi:hypothetical protein
MEAHHYVDIDAEGVTADAMSESPQIDIDLEAIAARRLTSYEIGHASVSVA